MKMARNSRGFTLIELLVVIAIIAILAAILFPLYASVKFKAKQTTCGSNIRQIAVALLGYADDWQNCLPGLNAFGALTDISGTLTNKGPVWKYVKCKQVFVCPLYTWRRDLSDPDDAPLNFTYTMNGYMTIAETNRRGANTRGEKLSKSRNASRTILLVDENCDPKKNEGNFVVNDALFIWEDRTGDRHPGTVRRTVVNGKAVGVTGFAPVGYLDTHIGMAPGLLKWQSPEGLALFYR